MSTPILTLRPGAGGVRVDLDQLVSSKLLIQANSGGGKSRMLRYLLEQLHGQIPQIVIDPEGEFASLREKFDYLLAGREGDVPADPKSAKVLCRRIMELGASAVIDLYELPIDARRKFVRLFLEELIHLPRTMWRPTVIAIDEVQMFAPERGHGEAESTGAVINLSTLARKRGLLAIYATQRLSKLHKDAAADLLNKLVGRTGLDVDMKRAADELGFDKDRRLTLRDLAPGAFYAFGPALPNGVTLVSSGPIQTTHPQPGKIAPPAPPPRAAVQKLVAQMQDLGKRAEEEAKTEAELRDQLARTQRRVRELERTKPDGGLSESDVTKMTREFDHMRRSYQEAESARGDLLKAEKQLNSQIKQLRGALEAAVKFIVKISAQDFDVAGVSKEEIERAITAAVTKATGIVDQRLAARAKEIERLRESARQIAANLTKILGDTDVIVDLSVTRNEAFTVSPDKPRARDRSVDASRNGGSGSGDIRGGEHAVLTAACQYPDGVTREQLSILTGYKRSSRDTFVQRLRARGLVEVSGDLIIAADGAEAHLGDFTPLPTGADLRLYWLDKLAGGEREILRVLIKAYPDRLSRDDISANTDYKRSSRDTFIQRLNARKLITIDGGSVRAAALLFE